MLPDIGHTDDFWTYQTPASNRLINTYLDSGRVDTSLYTRTPVDFTPALGHGPIAKIVLGVMLALAALTVLSLVYMALRVRWRGPFGRKSSVGATHRLSSRARSGRLVPRHPDRADDERRRQCSSTSSSCRSPWACRSVSASISPGSNRASATPTNTGLAAAAGGALIGAWLGFNVTSAGFGFLAPFVAIVGATVGANLDLIGLDILWDRQTRARSIESTANDTLESRLSTGMTR